MGGCMGSSEMYFFWLFSLMDFVKKLPHVYTVLVVIFRKVGDRERGVTGPRGVVLGLQKCFFFGYFPGWIFVKNYHTCI